MSSKQLLLDLINSTNYPTVPLSVANVELLNVQPVTGSAQWNTSVNVSAIAGAGYTGARTLYYRRLDLAVLANQSFSVSAAATPQALLDALNAATSADLGLEDLQSFVVPTPAAGSSQLCNLAADPGSYRWIGEVAVTIVG